MARTVNWLSWPNVAMSRGYGWRGACPAADVPDVGDGSVEWFGPLSAEVVGSIECIGFLLVSGDGGLPQG